MDQIIEAFGIDWRLIIIQIVNFGLLMAALSYFLYKPVIKMLDERSEKIAQGVADADAAKGARAEAEGEKQVVLQGAQGEAAAIAERARVHAASLTEEASRDAQTKAAAIVADAEARAREEKLRALKESEAEIVKLAILATEKLIRERA